MRILDVSFSVSRDSVRNRFGSGKKKDLTPEREAFLEISRPIATLDAPQYSTTNCTISVHGEPSHCQCFCTEFEGFRRDPRRNLRDPGPVLEGWPVLAMPHPIGLAGFVFC